MEQELEKEMIVEDEIARKGLVSVDNIWVVDRLRERLAGKDKIIAEKDKIIAEKDEEIARLKRRLGLDP